MLVFQQWQLLYPGHPHQVPRQSGGWYRWGVGREGNSIECLLGTSLDTCGHIESSQFRLYYTQFPDGETEAQKRCIIWLVRGTIRLESSLFDCKPDYYSVA